MTSPRRPHLLMCAPEHPLAGDKKVRLVDLRDQLFADGPQTWGTRMIADPAFSAAEVQREVGYEINDIATLLDFAAKNLAITLLPPRGHSNFASSQPVGISMIALRSPLEV